MSKRHTRVNCHIAGSKKPNNKISILNKVLESVHDKRQRMAKSAMEKQPPTKVIQEVMTVEDTDNNINSLNRKAPLLNRYVTSSEID